MWRMGDVRYSRHANCLNGCSQDMVGSVFKVRLGQPVMVVTRKRGLVEGVFREEEICPEFIDGLGKRVRYADGAKR